TEFRLTREVAVIDHLMIGLEEALQRQAESTRQRLFEISPNPISGAKGEDAIEEVFRQWFMGAREIDTSRGWLIDGERDLLPLEGMLPTSMNVLPAGTSALAATLTTHAIADKLLQPCCGNPTVFGDHLFWELSASAATEELLAPVGINPPHPEKAEEPSARVNDLLLPCPPEQEKAAGEVNPLVVLLIALAAPYRQKRSPDSARPSE